jgi:hypothetical protein
MKKDEFTSPRKTSKQEFQKFTYQFTNQFGNYLIIDRDPILYTSEISTTQRKMIESNEIPRHLSLDIREADFQVMFYYRIGQKNMLSSRLKANGLTKNNGILLLRQLIAALQDSKNYMFDHTNYLLDIDFVFTGDEIDDIFLTYVPLKSQRPDHTLHSQWLYFLNQLLLFSNQECKHIIEEMVRLCQHSFTLDQCKHFLMDYQLKNENINHKRDSNHANIEFLPNQTSNSQMSPLQGESSGYGFSEPIQIEHKGIEHKSIEHESIEHGSIDHESIDHESIEHESIEHDILEFIPVPIRIKIWVSLCASLFLIIIWKLVADYQGGSFIYVGFGLTLLIISCWLMICMLGFPNISNPRDVIRRLRAKHRLPSKKQSTEQNPSLTRISDDQMEDTQDAEQYYQQLHLKTTLLRKNHDNTTILSQSDLNSTSQDESSKQQKAIITYQNHNEQVNIEIDQHVFRIGRGEKEVDFRINDNGVSRVHAEIIKTTEGYVLKDLNSKNGLMLNELSLVPYQSYPLADGDMIRIVRNKLIFRIY